MMRAGRPCRAKGCPSCGEKEKACPCPPPPCACVHHLFSGGCEAKARAWRRQGEREYFVSLCRGCEGSKCLSSRATTTTTATGRPRSKGCPSCGEKQKACPCPPPPCACAHHLSSGGCEGKARAWRRQGEREYFVSLCRGCEGSKCTKEVNLTRDILEEQGLKPSQDRITTATECRQFRGPRSTKPTDTSGGDTVAHKARQERDGERDLSPHQVKRFKVSHGASPIGRSHKLPQDLATTRPCTVVCADPPLQQAAATNVPLTAYFQITPGSLTRVKGEAVVGASVDRGDPPSGHPVVVEVTPASPGKRGLVVVANGDEMVEASAAAAWAWVKGNYHEICRAVGCVEPRVLDLNLVLEGLQVTVGPYTLRKRGPSLGAAIAVAFVGYLTKCPIKTAVAVTGAIALSGALTSVGGTKLKAEGVRMAGIRTMVCPSANADDDVTGTGVKLLPCSNLWQVIRETIEINRTGRLHGASLLPSFGPSQNTCYYGAVKSLEYLFSPDDASFLAVDIMDVEVRISCPGSGEVFTGLGSQFAKETSSECVRIAKSLLRERQHRGEVTLPGDFDLCDTHIQVSPVNPDGPSSLHGLALVLAFVTAVVGGHAPADMVFIGGLDVHGGMVTFGNGSIITRGRPVGLDRVSQVVVPKENAEWFRELYSGKEVPPNKRVQIRE